MKLIKEYFLVVKNASKKIKVPIVYGRTQKRLNKMSLSAQQHQFALTIKIIKRLSSIAVKQVLEKHP